MIKHWQNCNANYPEKPDGEEVQGIQVIDMEDDTEVHQCVDCGAFELVKKENTNDLK